MITGDMIKPGGVGSMTITLLLANTLESVGRATSVRKLQ